MVFEKLTSGIRTRIREIMQNTYFVIPNYDNVDNAYEEVKDILNKLNNTNYEITPDFVEARSLATVAKIILEEIKEGINLWY